MGTLSQKLQVKLSQKQVLTPSLVQAVTLLQMTRLELKDLITAEVAQNPVLEDAQDGGEELTPEEVQALLESERTQEPADQTILDATRVDTEPAEFEAAEPEPPAAVIPESAPETAEPAPAAETKTDADPFDEIDYGSFFDDYLDPGFKTPASESVEKPSFETFLSSPVTLSDHLHSQLALVSLPEAVRDAAEAIIGNLDENGYLMATIAEMAAAEGHEEATVQEALRVVQTLDPAGVACHDLRECLLLQIESRNGKGGVAWQIADSYMKMLEARQYKELAKALKRPLAHIQVAVDMIKHLDPRPGLRYSGPGARQIEPDVYITKDGDDYLITLNDDEIPQLRLNSQYRHMLDRDKEPNADVRRYMKEKFASALQLMKNIEQRKQTILRVCQNIIRRQTDFLERGIDELKPMMIKEIAEEIGVHPSTVSRAVSGKYAHTPQGVFELRFFFSEAVQGPSGGSTPLLILKRRVKKMIEEEDSAHPLTDEQITERLQGEGIQVTRRTVAKYREDMRIPSTHQRRVKP